MAAIFSRPQYIKVIHCNNELIMDSYLPTFVRVALLTLGQSWSYPSTSQVTLWDMGKVANIQSYACYLGCIVYAQLTEPLFHYPEYHVHIKCHYPERHCYLSIWRLSWKMLLYSKIIVIRQNLQNDQLFRISLNLGVDCQMSWHCMQVTHDAE